MKQRERYYLGFIVLLVCTALMVCCALPAFADFTHSEWRYFRQATGNLKASYLAVRLDDAIYDRCQESLADLRIIDNANKEIPFKLVEKAGATDLVEQQANILNLSVTPGRTTFSVDMGEAARPHNRIKINTSNENFLASVKIEGADSQRSWHMLTDDRVIFNLQRGDNPASSNIVSYPESDYRYLRVTLTPDKQGELVRVENVAVERIQQKQSKERIVFRSDKGLKLSKSAEGSFLILDLRYRQPANRMEIRCDDKNFYRNTAIFGSNDKRTWNTLGSGTIFDFDTAQYKESKLTTSFSSTHNRYLKLLVADQDDEPLTIRAVSVYDYERALFFPNKGSGYRLYYGNSKAHMPSYDLEHIFPYLDPTKAAIINLGPERLNPEFEVPKRPWTEENRALFWGFLAISAVMLGFFSVRLIRQITLSSVDRDPNG